MNINEDEAMMNCGTETHIALQFVFCFVDDYPFLKGVISFLNVSVEATDFMSEYFNRVVDCHSMKANCGNTAVISNLFGVLKFMYARHGS